jgi:hypothetical protein
MASILALSCCRSGEPPSVPFKISRAVLALSIRLIDWLRIDASTGPSGLLVMRIDVVHVHEETRIRDVSGLRGIEVMFRDHTVQPDCGVTRADLTVDDLALGVPVHTAAAEAERTDQEIVSSADVPISQNRNDSLEIRHGVYPFHAGVLQRLSG